MVRSRRAVFYVLSHTYRRAAAAEAQLHSSTVMWLLKYGYLRLSTLRCIPADGGTTADGWDTIARDYTAVYRRAITRSRRLQT